MHDTWNSCDDLNNVGKSILSSDNLCDRSLHSEAVSGSRIATIFSTDETKVSLWKTETDVKYWSTQCKKIDFIVGFTIYNNIMIKVAVETKRISTFNNKVVLSDGVVDSILDNALAKARDGLTYVCSVDRWSFCILHLLITDVSTIDQVDKWIAKTDNIPFTSIVITFVTGNVDLIF